MPIAQTLQHFLQDARIDYQLVTHPYSERALHTATSAQIPVSSMTKAIILNDTEGYVMAVIPSTNRLVLHWINVCMDRNLHMVREKELTHLFPDCAPGAVPAVGAAYNMTTCWDDELSYMPDIYIEGGNHIELVQLARKYYKKLLKQQPHAAISCDPEEAMAYSNV
ncbi:hypothetical protein CI610_00621 [invertebrate metagenome]|uniref:YbaK/aminoacyl-tRNA synthetase-associated domain-containing protein n=1 Tax=invertebrate metagenome TaxID=1711999 RepID=A0A2H9TB22_9ZZZZ